MRDVDLSDVAYLRDEIDALRDQLADERAEHHATIDQRERARSELRRSRAEFEGLERYAAAHRCTPAERELIDAALAHSAAWDEVRAANYAEPSVRGLGRASINLRRATDRVLADRAEAL